MRAHKKSGHIVFPFPVSELRTIRVDDKITSKNKDGDR